jgi:hypothetical protein
MFFHTDGLRPASQFRAKRAFSQDGHYGENPAVSRLTFVEIGNA